MWICLAATYFFLLRSDEMFASDEGLLHPVHCLRRRDVAFFSGDTQLGYVQGRQADSVEVRFPGHKADQFQLWTVSGSNTGRSIRTTIRVQDRRRCRCSENRMDVLPPDIA